MRIVTTFPAFLSPTSDRLYVSLSICPSVTVVYCIETAKDIIKLFLALVAPSL